MMNRMSARAWQSAAPVKHFSMFKKILLVVENKYCNIDLFWVNIFNCVIYYRETTMTLKANRQTNVRGFDQFPTVPNWPILALLTMYW